MVEMYDIPNHAGSKGGVMSDERDAERRRLAGDLADLQRELDELTRSLPEHSIKPGHMLRIDDLEEAIAEREAALNRLNRHSGTENSA